MPRGSKIIRPSIIVRGKLSSRLDLQATRMLLIVDVISFLFFFFNLLGLGEKLGWRHAKDLIGLQAALLRISSIWHFTVAKNHMYSCVCVCVCVCMCVYTYTHTHTYTHLHVILYLWIKYINALEFHEFEI